MAALRKMAETRGQSLASLIAEVDETRGEGANLSSALRVFVLKALQARIAPGDDVTG